MGRTREHQKITTGVSPRGSLALLKLARAWAALHGRTYVTPDDVKEFALPSLCHRLAVHPSLWDVPGSDQTLVSEILRQVPVPVLEGSAV